MKREFGRFLVVGTANTLLGWCVYWAALLVLPYHAAFILAFFAGVAFSAFAHSRFSFGTRLGPGGLAAYVVYCIGFYAFCAALLEVCVRYLGVPVRWANVAVTIGGLPVNFLGSRWLMTRYGQRDA